MIHENMEEIINTFHIDWKLLIAQLVNFGIVLFVLYKFAIKPLSKTMDERTREIEKSLDDAQKIKESLAKVEEANAEKILQAKKEAQEILGKARAYGQEQGQKMVDDAKKEVQTVIAAAKEQIFQEKQEMLKEVKSEVGELVVMAAKKILEKVTTKEIDSKLIEESLKQVQSKH